jgi:hypothetical protein
MALPRGGRQFRTARWAPVPVLRYSILAAKTVGCFATNPGVYVQVGMAEHVGCPL